MRPPREAYVRSSLTMGAVEVVTGIEMRDPDEYWDLLDASKRLVHSALIGWLGGSPAKHAERVEDKMLERWPDRDGFIEVCVGDDRDGWVQIYWSKDKQP